MLTILIFIDCSKMAQMRINTRNHTEEKPYRINLYFWQNWSGKKKKKVNMVSNIHVCMWVWYVLKEYCNFTMVTLRMWKLVKNSPFFKWVPFWNLISKKKTITVFWSILSKVHKKTQFCMWQLHFLWNKGKQEQAVDPFATPLLWKPNPLHGSTIKWLW